MSTIHMSTIRVANIQHPDAASPAITLDANGDATIPSLPSDLGDLSDVDTAGAADGEALVFPSGTWSPAEVGGGVGGGLEGTSYVFVAGDGTASENGTALAAVYTTAKAPTPYGNAPADDNRAWVIVAPGTYDTTLTMDGQFVNVVSLDGGMSIRLTGISVTANNVLVRGIDVGTANFLIGDDLAGLVAENCKGGDYSFGGDSTFGGNGTASGTFTNCAGGFDALGGYGTASGTFTNCIGNDFSFGGNGTLSGLVLRCRVTSGGFQTPSSGGKIRLSLMGNFAEVNTG